MQADSPPGCSAPDTDAGSRRARNVPCARPFYARPAGEPPIKQKPAPKGGSAIPVGGRENSVDWRHRDFPTSPILASPFGVHRRGAPKVSRFRAGCAATPEASLHSISAVLPGFPQTRAPWPVWRGSVAGPVRFAALSRKQAARLWHKARRWDRDTRQPGRHGGIIGRTALTTLYALLFDFLNHRTGRLDPSLDAIAAKAGCCRRAVVDALARLRDLGLLHWQRRCEETRDAEGRFRVPQRTNAYGLLPPSQWRGYRDTDPPPPDPATLGAPESIPDPIEAAVAEITNGQRKAAMAALEAESPRQTGDGAGRARPRNGRNLTECICCQETLPRIF